MSRRTAQPAVNYTYDKLNRKTAEYTGSVTQGSGTEVAAWTWDTLRKGLLSYETSITGGGTYKTGVLGYNAEGQPTGTAVQVPAGQPLAGTYKTGYSYSTTGLLLGETPAAGGGLPADSLTWTYDKYGNPVTEAGYDTYVSAATWTPLGQAARIGLGTGPSAATLTYGYDPRTGAVTSVNLSDNEPSPQVDNTAYSYNHDQQITKITDVQGAAGTTQVETQCFSYDGLSRLTEAWSAKTASGCGTDPAAAGNSTVAGPQPYWQSWTYDELGDFKTQTTHALAGSTAGTTTTTYNYGVTGHAHAVSQVSAASTATGATTTTAFGYNKNGSMKTMGGTALTWNYNGTLAAAGTADSYIYSAGGTELAATTSAGTTLFLPGEQITQNTSGTTTGVRYYTFAGAMIGESTGGSLYWTETGLHGTVTAVVDAFSESLPATYRTLTPYGQVVTSGGTPAWPDDRTFLNDPVSPDTGLVDIGARKYDPALGLFISVDPVLNTAAPQTMTGYTYAGDNPVNSADPTGMSPASSACETNITACLNQAYAKGGGQYKSSGIPTGKGYTPPPSPPAVPVVAQIPTPLILLPKPSLVEQPQQYAINDFLDRPELLTGQTPEALLGLLGWSQGAPANWQITRLLSGGHKGLGFVLREQVETPSGKLKLSGTMMRWYPGNGRYAKPNWKVSVTGKPKFTGPDGQGYPTPQSEYWNGPGSPEEIIQQINAPAAPPESAPVQDGGIMPPGSGNCACGGVNGDEIYGTGSGEDPVDIFDPFP